MQTRTAKAVLLAGLLLQGIHMVPAKAEHTKVSLNKSSFALNRDNPPSSNTKTTQASQKELSSELKAPESLAIPIRESEVQIKQFRELNLKDVQKLVKENNPELKIMRKKINQAKSLLLEALSNWYPSLDLSANGLPEYLRSEQYNSSNLDTSSSQWKTGLSLKVKWEVS